MPADLLTDILVNSLATFAVFRFAYSLFIRQKAYHPSERRLLFLLIVTGTLLFLRGFLWVWPQRWLGVVVYIPAALLPLAIGLYFEGLSRRHFPLWMKAYLTLGTTTVSILNLSGGGYRNPALTQLNIIFTLGLLAYLLIHFGFRNRKELTPPENRFLDATLISLLFYVLFISDSRQIFSAFPQRMGAISALIFVYLSLRALSKAESNLSILGELVTFIAQAGFIALCNALVFPMFTPLLYLRSFLLALSFMLVIKILNRLKLIEGRSSDQEFVTWMGQAPLQTQNDFLKDLKNYSSTEEHVLLDDEALARLGTESLMQVWKVNSNPVVHQRDLRAIKARALATKNSELALATEELLELLKKYQMTHACLIQSKPARILLLVISQAAQEAILEREINVIQRVAQVLPL